MYVHKAKDHLSCCVYDWVFVKKKTWRVKNVSLIPLILQEQSCLAHHACNSLPVFSPVYVYEYCWKAVRKKLMNNTSVDTYMSYVRTIYVSYTYIYVSVAGWNFYVHMVSGR